MGGALLGVVVAGATVPASRPPNIVVILADDLGYGSVGCYGTDQVKTPHIDRMAREGMLFTAAHSPSSVCTPSRFNLLTGRYCWRSVPAANARAEWEQWHRVKTMPGDAWIGHVAVEANEPLLIEPGRMTLASQLRQAGYATACVGKWHLGMGRPGTPGWSDELGPDWNRELAPGPWEIGFDYFFGLPVVNSSEPRVFVENRRVIGLDPADPIRLVPEYDRFGRLGFKMEGGAASRFEQNHIDDRHAEKAVAWIERTAASSRPFFLYLPLSSPHWPFVPSPRYQGKSPLGARGDAMEEVDGCVGDILAVLDRLGIADETLVIFTSDNGAQAGATKRSDHAEFKGLLLNGPLRGQKTEIYEAAHRIPFVVRWPGRVPAGRISQSVIALTDLMATFAEITGQPLPADAGEDSFSFLPVLLGRGDAAGRRQSLITDSMTGVLAIQEGPWKYIPIPGHGGYYADDPAAYVIDPAAPPAQLYNLEDDIAETNNLYAAHPELAERLARELERIKFVGRSRP